MITGALRIADIAELAARCGEREADSPDVFSEENFSDVRKSGLLSGPLPASLGGSGWTLRDAADAIETLARRAPSMALLASMPVGLAGAHAVGVDAAPREQRQVWGEQIERFAERARAGTWYAAANSEKGAGGSLENTKTVAALGADGVWRLDGEKILGSAGRYADFFFSVAKVDPEQLPGCGVVETFFVRTDAEGVEVLSDWDGFGMRPTESNTVRYASAPAAEMWGFPNFIGLVQPVQYWYCLFSAIALGCARAMLDALGTPAPESPALRLRLSDALMRYEALRAYLGETADGWRAGAGPVYAARVLRTKTHVTSESVRLCAELFALTGGRRYRRGDALARTLADVFAGTALRPPLALALDQLVQQFSLEGV
jgi:alkylation response protein AidB-like acyl-CoA dehydrogenase